MNHACSALVEFRVECGVASVESSIGHISNATPCMQNNDLLIATRTGSIMMRSSYPRGMYLEGKDVASNVFKLPAQASDARDTIEDQNVSGVFIRKEYSVASMNGQSGDDVKCDK
jgi:hypothetical protein